MRLSDRFTGVAVKRLSAVEASPHRSNQHEFNGVDELRRLFGDDKQRLPTKFVWLGEDEEELVSSDAFVTWYDARERHPTRTEYRLYFPRTSVSDNAAEGDLLLVAVSPDHEVLCVVAEARSTAERQLLWLFGMDEPTGKFESQAVQGATDPVLNFAGRFILAEIGVEAVDFDTTRLDEMIRRFPGGFPTTRDFSAFARETLAGIEPRDDPDAALIAWLDHEERLFRTYERHLMSDRLTAGFVGPDGPDVDAFVSFSLSVQNRRKSRVGNALENHIEPILAAWSLRYTRKGRTENNASPDFVFPGIDAYNDSSFPADRLTILGAKSTCKDRWRQVLAEAQRVPRKHLLTLQPGISESQTSEMQANGLQLVLPRAVHATYKADQQRWLMSVADLLHLARSRQAI